MSVEKLHLATLAAPASVGEAAPAFFLVAGDRPMLIGRSSECDVILAGEDVSRKHATIIRRGDRWLMQNLSARSRTLLNGVELAGSRPAMLQEGDLVRLGSWTFRVGEAPPGTHAGAMTIDDSRVQGVRIERATHAPTVSVSDQRMKLLTGVLTRFRQEGDVQGVARAAIEAAVAGCGFARGAVLMRTDGHAGVEIIATSHFSGANAAGPADIGAAAPRRESAQEGFTFSRSLIEQASQGFTAVATVESGPVSSHSIVQLGIHTALCAPFFIGPTPAGFIYLDARASEKAPLVGGAVDKDGAAAFADAVAIALGLVLAERNRRELEQRQTQLASELQAARAVQELILPATCGDVGPVRYAVSMIPGLFVAGDLFDVIALEGARVGVCIGDASGHGAGSAMQMAMAQAYLHSELRRSGDPARAVSAVNAYIAERSGSGRFVSLWVGVIDRDGTMTFVDAGHGHCMLDRPSIGAQALRSRAGIPLGVDGEYRYSSEQVRLFPDDRLILYTDGVHEQRSPSGERFGTQRLADALPRGEAERTSADATVSSVVRALAEFTSSAPLDDDATIACVRLR
ncbi:MAG: SpoIIE family protein phosphatase [Phycisphaerales bacterium]|nr:SpoIIE family protein phosphatase [Phycisphaeraceae bacterium]